MLPEELKELIQEEVHTCEHRYCASIEALVMAQNHYGWVSDETLRDVADFLEMTIDELDSVATFYNHIYRRQVGRHVILVCDSVSCWIMGYERLQDHFMKSLGIKLGETTADGRFTLLPVQCLGACDRAPAMMVDQELFCELDTDKIDRILEDFR